MIEFDRTPYQVEFSIPYVNVAVLMFQKEKLSKLNQYPRIVVDATHDGWTHHDVRQHLAMIDYRGEAVILTNKYGAYDDLVVFFPYWFYRNSVRFADQPLVPLGNRKWHLSCLNRNPTAFRLYLYYCLMQQPWVDEMMLSINGLTCPYSKQELALDHERFLDLPGHAKSWLQQNPLVRPAFVGDRANNWDEPGNPGDHNWLHPAFSNTYMNIVTESGVSTGFFSEKTFKPLAAGQLFLMVADRNSVQALKRLGFETFESDLDEHRYDKTANFVDRIDALVKWAGDNFNNIPDIYYKNISGIEYNQHYILSDAFRNSVLAPLQRLDILRS